MSNKPFENAAPPNLQQDDWFLKTLPRAPSQFAQWTIAAVVAAPFALAAGFVLTAQPADGAFVLPFIAFGIHRLLSDLFCSDA